MLHYYKQRYTVLQTVFKESIERFNVNDNKPLSLSIEPLKNSILRATLQKTLHITSFCIIVWRVLIPSLSSYIIMIMMIMIRVYYTVYIYIYCNNVIFKGIIHHSSFEPYVVLILSSQSLNYSRVTLKNSNTPKP